ncbi:hypothetical protein BLNAU_3532 [Blattamonas nauphoetae]|uniref:Uncharacterized protein n=1 Tax=Blattamonas nauphoetae TaxID=2049346 RepID=A0ABQ9YCB7_9EUKA|nr:hypothetical protein BLNAU_3532 [Blattamonas nauphoetae]
MPNSQLPMIADNLNSQEKSMKMTKNHKDRIFLEMPQIHQAYLEHVKTGKMTEKDFWNGFWKMQAHLFPNQKHSRINHLRTQNCLIFEKMSQKPASIVIPNVHTLPLATNALLNIPQRFTDQNVFSSSELLSDGMNPIHLPKKDTTEDIFEEINRHGTIILQSQFGRTATTTSTGIHSTTSPIDNAILIETDAEDSLPDHFLSSSYLDLSFSAHLLDNIARINLDSQPVQPAPLGPINVMSIGSVFQENPAASKVTADFTKSTQLKSERKTTEAEEELLSNELLSHFWSSFPPKARKELDLCEHIKTVAAEKWRKLSQTGPAFERVVESLRRVEWIWAEYSKQTDLSQLPTEIQSKQKPKPKPVAVSSKPSIMIKDEPKSVGDDLESLFGSEDLHENEIDPNALKELLNLTQEEVSRMLQG